MICDAEGAPVLASIAIARVGGVLELWRGRRAILTPLFLHRGRLHRPRRKDKPGYGQGHVWAIRRKLQVEKRTIGDDQSGHLVGLAMVEGGLSIASSGRDFV